MKSIKSSNLIGAKKFRQNNVFPNGKKKKNRRDELTEISSIMQKIFAIS